MNKYALFISATLYYTVRRLFLFIYHFLWIHRDFLLRNATLGKNKTTMNASFAYMNQWSNFGWRGMGNVPQHEVFFKNLNTIFNIMLKLT